MSDTRTQAEKDAARALVAAYLKRREEEQATKRPNPLQQPTPYSVQADREQS